MSPICLVKHNKSTNTHVHTQKYYFFENFDLIIQIISLNRIEQKMSSYSKKAKYKWETECIWVIQVVEEVKTLVSSLFL